MVAIKQIDKGGKLYYFKMTNEDWLVLEFSDFRGGSLGGVEISGDSQAWLSFEKGYRRGG
jgi:hypothetical protein